MTDPASENLTNEELARNLRIMMAGASLLKFGKRGPRFRRFWVQDRCLKWESKTKNAEDSSVAFSQFKAVSYGQRTPRFQQFRTKAKDMQAQSFSIIFDKTGAEESLDLVCKDEREWLVWARSLFAVNRGQATDDVWELALQYAKTMPVNQSADAGLQYANTVVEADLEADSNDVYSFGWGHWGQCSVGHDLSDSFDQPQLVKKMLGQGIVAAACGWSHTAVVQHNGQLWEGGSRVGTGKDKDLFSLKECPVKLSVAQLALGAYHSAIVTGGGQVFTWGCNLRGQLGHDDFEDLAQPKAVQALSHVMIEQVKCGEDTTVCLSQDGQVYTWGANAYGQLGHNDATDRSLPTLVTYLSGIERIVAGAKHMFACTSREVFAWGCNRSGQLGLGHTQDQPRPHSVEKLRGDTIISFACGAAHSAAVMNMVKLSQCVLFVWGSNSLGQLGLPQRTNALRPTPANLPVSGEEQIDSVSCGDAHTCFVTDQGNVYSTGSNMFGQLGLGHKQSIVSEFKRSEFFKDKLVRIVECGGAHTIVLCARRWIDDKECKECMQCKSAFTLINRKHHCRNCGGIFCNNCSSKKVTILKLGSTEPVRVCESCHTKLVGRAK